MKIVIGRFFIIFYRIYRISEDFLRISEDLEDLEESEESEDRPSLPLKLLVLLSPP